MLTPDQKGSIAEIAIAHAAILLGVGVFKPLTDGERYDLIFDTRPRLLRVQCKWAVRQGGVLVVNCRSCRRTANGFLRRPYTPDEVDAVAAYCAATDRCYLLLADVFAGRQAVQLRVTNALNNQKLGINWADDFEFAAKLSELRGP